MSISIMSLVFNATFEPLQYVHKGKDKEGVSYSKRITVMPTRIKLVLLAYADHANDEGVSAYPGLTKLELKTGISRSGIVQTKKALIEHGFLVRAGESKRHTDDMTIIVSKLHEIQGSSPRLPVASSPSTPEVVAPDYPNHPEPSFEPSTNEEKDMPKEFDQELIPYLKALQLSTTEPYPSDLRRASTMRTMRESELRRAGTDEVFIDVPADVYWHLKIFVEEFGRSFLKSEKPDWIKDARRWTELGATPSDVKAMFRHCRAKGMTIKRPGSITWAWDEIRTTKKETKTEQFARTY